jgi:hypothetical protein
MIAKKMAMMITGMSHSAIGTYSSVQVAAATRL